MTIFNYNFNESFPTYQKGDLVWVSIALQNHNNFPFRTVENSASDPVMTTVCERFVLVDNTMLSAN